STDPECDDRTPSDGFEYVLSEPLIFPLTPFLLNDLGYGSRAHGAAAFAYREAQSLVHGHRGDQFHRQTHVVARHHHLRPLGQLRHSRHVRRAEIELRPVSLEERRVPPPLFLAQYVHGTLELRVRRDRPRLRDHLPAL